jgi:glycosyltransferase involved in cell wall biosynthesis
MVSVIIPAYNVEAFLAEAIESILRQPYRPLEIIVVDDGSTDGTAAVAQQFGPPVTYHYRANGGPAAARNTGLSLAQGDFITFLDADDWWPADKLERQLTTLAENPQVDITVGRTQLMVRVATGGRVSYQPWQEPLSSYLFGCSVMRRSVFDQVGLFDESQFYAEDLDWFLRAREAGLQIFMEPAVVLYSRRHQHNMTNQAEPSYHYLAVALKKSLDRKRRAVNSEQ